MNADIADWLANMSDDTKALNRHLANEEIGVLDDTPRPRRVIEVSEAIPVVTVGNGSVQSQYAEIDIRPFGKARPRVTQNGTYMPYQYTRKKKHLAAEFGPVEVQGAVLLEVTAVLKVATSISKKKRAELLGTPATCKPDIDNIAGAVMDALFPDDDSRVVSINCTKVWGEWDCLQIWVKKVE